MIKAIFFDFFEVITYGDFGDVYQNFADRVDISVDTVSEYHAKNLGGLLTGSVTSHDMLTAFKLEGHMNVEEMLTVWAEETQKLMSADPDMISLLVKLKENYILGALTNLTEQRFGGDIQMGLYDYFDFNVLSFKVGMKKPDKRFYETALRLAECQPEETVFIDDQVQNTDAAAALGIHSIQYTDTKLLTKQLQDLDIKV
ncbi:MAG: HAD family phosphatase [Patescibacteria group bacterium]